MTSTYWITVQTEQVYPTTASEEGEGSFDWVAGHLVTACEALFTSSESIRSITRSDTITETTTEVEVRLLEPDSLQSPVLARVLFNAEAPGKVGLDKNRMSTLLRSRLPFPVKVLKRALGVDEVLAIANA